MSVGLMYSGGVDSVLCLKILVEQGITPVIFHVRTAKLSNRHERMIKRNVKRLSPKSPFYVIQTDTLHYNAMWSYRELDYYVYLNEWARDGEALHPLRYVDKLAIGYFYAMGKRCKRGEICVPQPHFVKWVKIYKPPIILPLGEKTGKEINKMFSQLPIEIQKDTVSSTRFYKHNGETVGKPRFITRLGDYGN